VAAENALNRGFSPFAARSIRRNEIRGHDENGRIARLLGAADDQGWHANPREQISHVDVIHVRDDELISHGVRRQVAVATNNSVSKSYQMSTARSAGKKAVRKNTASRKVKIARPLRKKMDSESKSNRLVCRYCGSEDLAPSFIKRRDRRCRKCFSKRYGSAARAKKAKVKR
jgi:hypothetical protein